MEAWFIGGKRGYRKEVDDGSVNINASKKILSWCRFGSNNGSAHIVPFVNCRVNSNFGPHGLLKSLKVGPMV